ncbi:leucine dehydrogenase [Litorivivens lipolytica]|uniref:Leucine dehydrogenase n=1 Tax=Litorivivens lipolytica TaxID=1524264 RepID=A0A7W4Z647_9GAMM|nr:Glu/Leu/Phe/Val dehydrogenase [Litorivivens lipolytica]MBB3047807.1 leucine dehydrogenase [Litorivivens lipolytica]
MSIFSDPAFDGHELVAFHEHAASGLRAIVAVHNASLGPAVGGCRMYAYDSDAAALNDVLRLSRGMTYKSALAGIPLGGGKSVIIGDPKKLKNRELLLAFGEFIDSLNGRYVTAEDSGTTVADMKVIGERTAHVSGVTSQQRFGGDPSPYTAYGVYCGIRAALRFQRGTDDLKGLRIAIQGVGAVGRHLAERLLRQGADVIVADVCRDNLSRAEKLGARIVPVEDILSVRCDVLAPCAMGAVINPQTVTTLRTDIVAGAANNQLATPLQSEQLLQRGILYAPDFVINAGGIIDVYYQQQGGSSEQSEKHVERIADTLTEIFNKAEGERQSTHAIAEAMAESIFRGEKGFGVKASA